LLLYQKKLSLLAIMRKEVIFIEKGERAPLPSKYRPLNNLCAVLYDHLTELFTGDVYKPLMSTTMTFQNDEQARKWQPGSLHVLDYLKEAGYNEQLTTVLTKHILLSVVSDMVNFAFESISCAKRGKMTVAYALLRKPFRDELLLLENLLNSPDDFIQKLFHNGDPKEYDPSKLKEAKVMQIMEEACQKVSPKIFEVPQLYDFRYNRDYPLGISGFSDQALHIVTDNGKYPTSNQNLNFVFSNQDDIKRYWSHYYRLLPYLLLYTAAVVDAIAFLYLDGDDAKHRKNEKIVQRFLGMILWLEKAFPGKKDRIGESLSDSPFQVTCDHCGRSNELDVADYELYFYTQRLICPNCLDGGSVDKSSRYYCSQFEIEYR